MSEDDPTDLTTKPLNSKYLSGLLDNISATQDYLVGNDGIPHSSSFFPPNAIWTPQEKNAFFHALSTYSRFRPDLISHEVKTKSVSDVCNYLSVLQLATSQQESIVSYSKRRENLPIAMEVSSEWVAMEEETAFNVVAREQDWQRELDAEQRRAEVKLLKKGSKTVSHDMEPSRHKAELKRAIADADLRGRQKDYCGSLGSLELTAIGTILREATNSSSSSQIKQSFPPPHDSPLPRSPGEEAGLEATQISPASATKGRSNILNVDTAVQLTNDISNPFPQSPRYRIPWALCSSG